MRRPSIPAIAVWALLATGLAVGVARGEDAAPIEDNSFLIEEAYNQEPRVVQHIATWMRLRGGGAWEATFTQEWPAASQRHQLSYTIPLQRLPDAGVAAGARGIGDVALNYRFQALGVVGGPVAFAPRISALLASGDSDRGLGAGAPGLQLNLPLSLALSRRWVTHTNAGLTWIRARDGIQPAGTGARPARRGANLGQSLIWLPASRVNLMLELAWDRSEAPGVAGDDDREEGLLLAPGIRWAHDFASGLQIVPGIAVPIGLGPSRGERSVFLYVSFEHGF